MPREDELTEWCCLVVAILISSLVVIGGITVADLLFDWLASLEVPA